MPGIEPMDVVERFVREHVGAGFHLRADSTWLTIRPHGAPVLEHGWKLHVSSRVATFPELVEKLLPVLLAEGCAFKLARETKVLARLNDGVSSAAAVGKAFTVYPAPSRVGDLGRGLALLLRGHEGPRVLSDRRVDPEAPVYYRYGPFIRSAPTGLVGGPAAVLHGPAGQEFEAPATMRYRQPDWTVDPFTGESADDLTQVTPQTGPAVLAGRYTVVSGLFQSGRGDVLRAVDGQDGARVVVKQARAFVDENDRAADVRMRVRNERRVLTALSGVPGIPRFVDHFALGRDEYLVTTDVGEQNLADDLTQRGRYLPAAAPGAVPGRSLEHLATALTRILLSVHARGVTVRDLSPRNVVVGDGGFSLIDFGMADYEGFNLQGGTPGYVSARQRRSALVHQGDDLFALGMVLAFAATALPPVTHGEHADEARLRMLETIDTCFGSTPPTVIRLVADLLGSDDEAQEAARRIAAGDFDHEDGLPRTRLRTHRAVEPTPALTSDITQSLLELLQHSARAILGSGNESLTQNVAVYNGIAGIGLELLENLESPGVAEILAELAPHCARTVEKAGLRQGLFTGRTGVDVFLARAAHRGVDVGGGNGLRLPASDWKPEDFDLMAGAAGIGLGYLAMYEIDERTEYLAVAQQCAEYVIGLPLPSQDSMQDPIAVEAAVEGSVSRAHGLAGMVEVLASVGRRSGDEAVLQAASERAAVLAKQARELADRSRGERAAPLSASWCQGTAGFSQTLLRAGDLLADPALTNAARYAVDAAVAHVPRMDRPIQCCGLAGIGNAVIDLALHDAAIDPAGSAKYWDAAWAVAKQMLLRRSGPAERPAFIRHDLADHSASWALGTAGMLSFFRRLDQRGSSDGTPLPHFPRREIQPPPSREAHGG
jgi:serine/threonine protein kinase